MGTIVNSSLSFAENPYGDPYIIKNGALNNVSLIKFEEGAAHTTTVTEHYNNAIRFQIAPGGDGGNHTWWVTNKLYKKPTAVYCKYTLNVSGTYEKQFGLFVSNTNSVRPGTGSSNWPGTTDLISQANGCSKFVITNALKTQMASEYSSNLAITSEQLLDVSAKTSQFPDDEYYLGLWACGWKYYEGTCAVDFSISELYIRF